MIAKPTNKTIPIAILLILIVALLGWLYEKKTSPTNASPPTEEKLKSQPQPST